MAFRLVVFSFFILAATPSVLCQQPTASPSPARTGKSYSSSAPANKPRPAPQAQSPVTFTDITTASNIKFKRAAALTSMKYLLEAMGSGVAMFDYDNDGRQDLFFANSGALKDPMPNTEIPDKRDPQHWDRLYRQKDDGSFEDVTEKAGLKGAGYSTGVATADYDNDGHTDLYLTGYANNFLYRNNGDGTFTDVTKKTGVGGSGWSSSAAWVDFDRDGRLDLFVGRYLQWDFDIGSVYCGELRPGYRAYCHPDNFKTITNILYRQRDDGSFEDVSAKSGIASEGGKALGVALADFDNDGWIDIFVANDSFRQSLFRNKGDGTFEDIAVASGAGYDENGKTFAGMGVDAGDYDNDGYLDIFITTLSNETYPLYHNDQDLNFTYATNSAGVGQITILHSGWGTRFIDVNNDGLRDIFVAQSHVLDTIEKTHPYLKYKQSPLLMLNTGKGFADVSATAGPTFLNSFIGRGAAFGDLNNDGQIDVVMSTLDGAPVLLRNNGTKNHWLGLSLVGSKSNRSGIGARVTVIDSSGRKQIFDANTAGSYLSSSDPRILVGLGSAASVRRVEVKWPSGTVQTISEPQIDRYLVITESNSK
ncbi:MAG TPA: CRTAC1 family protein [Pyrinomonadaceae bacterium]|nr:CRTAC1 family protein [Pyrinomonadaceae bacterium]